MEGKGLWLSQYNEVHDVKEQLNGFQKKIKIYDTTLRDGEQSVGVSFTSGEKLRIATALADAGIDRIEAGFPASSDEDKDAISKIVQNVKNAEIWGFGRCNVSDVKSNIETGIRHLVCETFTSPEKMKAWDINEEVVLKRVHEALSYAKNEGLYTAFFAVDATRTNLEFLKKVYQTAVYDCGADEIVLVDTLGVASPEAMGYLTKLVKSWVDVPIAIHCHNDFGQAIGCTIAGLKEGAECAHVTVNGLGEKTGNTDLATLLLNLTGFYNVETNVDLTKLYDLSALVSELSNFPISPMAPVVGEKVFTRESGLVVAQMLSYPPSVEGYSPEIVGRKREVALGKKSGRVSIEYALKQYDMTFPDDRISDLLMDVKTEGIRKHGTLNKDEFIKLALKYL